VPSQRFYPKAPCSESLNEVDFEYTMRNYLTGRVPEVESHTYIDPQKFPTDKWGEYSQTFSQRKVPYRCTQNLNSETLSADMAIYNDKSQSCNFSKKLGFQKCYLYTATNNGDTYQLAYFKEETAKFVIYSKFRDDPVKVVIE
jgi:predicted PolB exonuclease-like 3'-5' exonuclease